MKTEIQRWTNTAMSLGDDAEGLRVELQHLAANPTPARLARAISSAFWFAERGQCRAAAAMVDEMRGLLLR